MTLSTWDRVTPAITAPFRTTPKSKREIKQQKLTDYTTMPAQETVETMSIEEAQEEAHTNAPFGSANRETLERLERISGEERYRWAQATQRVGDNTLAFKAMNADSDLPSSAVRAIKDPEEWDELDPMNIEQLTCSATEKDLWKVELNESARRGRNDIGDDDVGYVDDSGHVHSGEYLTDREGEYYDVAEETDGFVSGEVTSGLEPHNNQSTSLVAFLPDEEVKIRVEKSGTIRRDLSHSDDSFAPLHEYPEIEGLLGAIIRGDEEDDALEEWTPVEARPENGSNREMQQKVEEIADTPEDEYYFDFPTVAVVGNEGAITGKRYVAVPDEYAEEADEWFDPELY